MRILPVCMALGALSALYGAGEAVTVEQAVAEALKNNLSLLAERANIDIARARVLAAGLRPNPVVSAESNHVDMLGTGFDSLNAGGPTEIVFETEFTYERAGKRRLRVAVAEGERAVAELQFRDAARGVVLEVQNAFVDALHARRCLELARETLGTFNQIVEVNTARVRAGDLAEIELIRSRLAALQYQTSIRQAELRLRTALIKLQTAMGRPRPSPTFDITGDLRRDPIVPSLKEFQEAALNSRPDLLALERDYQRAGAELQSQIAQSKPDLTFGAQFIRQQVNAKANSLGFSVSMPIPLFNRNQGEIARAQKERRQIELRIAALRASIAAETETAYDQYLTARSLLESIEGIMLQEARDVRDITEYTYRRGQASLLELLDAQRAFNETMQAYIDARAEYARSLYLLDSISGKVPLP
ncbi:MAG TPA: TolC family protein [Bryobacteraceae bacterium]|nr:TolC family protein [Bryobacteraceae bacterium]